MKFAIIGNGNSGKSAFRFLLSKKHKAEILDDKNGNLKAEIITKFDSIVLSPGVPRSHPALIAAMLAGIPICNEIELAAPYLSNSFFIGITGSNGKSTTTALLGHILKLFNPNTFIGGNFGTPLCDIFETNKNTNYIVLELSSFQLETIRNMQLNIAILLNLSPDHLDRYSTLNEYYAMKLRIFDLLKCLDGKIKFPSAFLPNEFYPSKKLIGQHNMQNMHAAILSAKMLEIPNEIIQKGLNTFPGLAHRLEILGYKKGVCWVNDSKATTVDSVISALQCFDHGVHLILGGTGKGINYDSLVFASRKSVSKIYLIGAEAIKIQNAFSKNSKIKTFLTHTLKNAVFLASKLAKPGETILLSPACSSYDQFTNFEHRGDVFKKLFYAF